LADGKIENFNAFKLDSPPRLVLDIWGVDTRKNSFKVKSALIKGVRIGHYQDKLRLVFDSGKPQLPPYQVNRIDDKLLVALGNIPQPSEPQIYLQEKSAKESPTISKVQAASRPKPDKTSKIEAKPNVPPPDMKREEASGAKGESAKKEDEVKTGEKPALELKKEEMKAEEKPIPPTPVAKNVRVEVEKKVFGEGEAQRVYTGRKLSLDFKDADIKNILRLIAEVSNLNIIVADEVTGKITMRLVDVPWDQALEIILQSKGLDKRQVGNVVRIALVDALRKEDQARLEEQRSKEKLEPVVNDLISVNYATAKEIMPQVKGILSERGDVKVDDRTNTLIIKDISRNLSAIRSLVRSLDTKTPQVIIEARIVEANLTFQEELGVEWGFNARGKVGDQTISVGGGIPGTSILGNSPPTGLSLISSLPAIASGGIGGIGTAGVLEMLMTSTHGLKQLDISISAHENKGNAKIISSPKIATLDNKEASIEQGLRIPYRKLTTEGTITIDFIEANLKLTVTPHVTNDGNIKMTVKAKKDAPDKSVVVDGVPSIDKKEAITEVMVKNNGVFVIAGVYSIEKDLGAEGIPLLDKIPIIGWLFKRETKQDIRKDLLIFISPKVVKDEV
jgi:type IV pilus assembly protein PilQ